MAACPIYVSVLTLRFKKVTSCRFAQNSNLQMSHFVFGSHLGLNLADASLHLLKELDLALPHLPYLGTCELGEEHLLGTLELM